MNVIAVKTLRAYADKHADARKPLMEWLDAAISAEWASLAEVRDAYPATDMVKVASGRPVCVFNIKGNTYRLIAAIHFNRGRVFILRFLTHAEYSKNSWKDQL